MEKYKIKKGDTLSNIAQKYGVGWKDIYSANTGTIKNPNLIYPGQTISIPTNTQTTTGGSSQSNIGGNTGNATNNIEDMSYRDWMFKTLEQQNKYLKDYIDMLKKQPSTTEVYKQYSEQLGLPKQAKLVSGIQKQVLDVEGLLDKLESDINTRTTGRLVTEAQRRRYLATEEKPLREQLADLMRAETRARAGYSEARQQLSDMLKMYEEEQGRQKEIVGLPLEYGYKNLPYYEKAFTYRTPEEKAKQELASKLATEKAMKEAGLGRYATGGNLVVQDTKGGKTYDIGSVTGLKEFISDHPEYNDWEKIKDYLTINSKMSQSKIQSLLNSVGLNPTKGKYTISFWNEAAREAIKNNVNSVDDFIAKMRMSFKDLSRQDIEVGKKAFEAVSKKTHGALWYLFHPKTK